MRAKLANCNIIGTYSLENILQAGFAFHILLWFEIKLL